MLWEFTAVVNIYVTVFYGSELLCYIILCCIILCYMYATSVEHDIITLIIQYNCIFMCNFWVISIIPKIKLLQKIDEKNQFSIYCYYDCFYCYSSRIIIIATIITNNMTILFWLLLSLSKWRKKIWLWWYNCDNNRKKKFSLPGMPVVSQALDGFNGTIFAYGQTGSGKSWSMIGAENNKGEENASDKL